MSAESGSDVTRLLREWSDGNASALSRLMELVYPELHRIAARHLRSERAWHTLQPTALVSEAYVRLAQDQPGRHWEDRRHFFAVAARVVRAVLVDHARARRAVKRGDGAIGVELNDEHAPVQAPAIDLLDLDVALTELEALNAEHSQGTNLSENLGDTAAAVQRPPDPRRRRG